MSVNARSLLIGRGAHGRQDGRGPGRRSAESGRNGRGWAGRPAACPGWCPSCPGPGDRRRTSAAAGGGAWPLFSGLGPVAALRTAPGLARAFTVMVLSGWGMAAMTETGTLIVSEFAANVVRAAEGPGGRSVYDEKGRMPVLWLRLMADAALLGIEVWDSLPPESGVPVLRHADPDAESGRGLGIVAALSQSLGLGAGPGPARQANLGSRRHLMTRTQANR